jgi:hypothetical protein
MHMNLFVNVTPGSIAVKDKNHARITFQIVFQFPLKN